MKKILMGTIALTVFSLGIILFQMSSCTKANAQTEPCKTDTVYVDTASTSFAGLWIGTYTDANAITLYDDFSIYPDGTISYKSLGEDNNVYFASGTWTLTGTAFSYSVTTINQPGGVQHTQTGTATYDSSKGTLTNGIITDLNNGSHSSFTMSRVN